MICNRSASARASLLELLNNKCSINRSVTPGAEPHAVGIAFCNLVVRWKVLESVVLWGYQAPSTHAFSGFCDPITNQ